MLTCLPSFQCRASIKTSNLSKSPSILGRKVDSVSKEEGVRHWTLLQIRMSSIACIIRVLHLALPEETEQVCSQQTEIKRQGHQWWQGKQWWLLLGRCSLELRIDMMHSYHPWTTPVLVNNTKHSKLSVALDNRSRVVLEASLVWVTLLTWAKIWSRWSAQRTPIDLMWEDR